MKEKFLSFERKKLELKFNRFFHKTSFVIVSPLWQKFFINLIILHFSHLRQTNCTIDFPSSVTVPIHKHRLTLGNNLKWLTQILIFLLFSSSFSLIFIQSSILHEHISDHIKILSFPPFKLKIHRKTLLRHKLEKLFFCVCPKTSPKSCKEDFTYLTSFGCTKCTLFCTLLCNKSDCVIH